MIWNESRTCNQSEKSFQSLTQILPPETETTFYSCKAVWSKLTETSDNKTHSGLIQQELLPNLKTLLLGFKLAISPQYKLCWTTWMWMVRRKGNCGQLLDLQALRSDCKTNLMLCWSRTKTKTCRHLIHTWPCTQRHLMSTNASYWNRDCYHPGQLAYEKLYKGMERLMLTLFSENFQLHSQE